MGHLPLCEPPKKPTQDLLTAQLPTIASFRYLLVDSLFPLFLGGMVWGRRPQAHTHFARAEGAEASVRQAAAIAPDDDWRGRTRDSKATKCKAQSPAEARAPAAPAAQIRRGDEEEGRKGGG